MKKRILLFLCSLFFIQSAFSQSVNAPNYTGSLNSVQVKFPMSFKGRSYSVNGAAMASQFSGEGGGADSSIFATRYWVKNQIPDTLNLISGANIAISGSYPNLTISSTGGSATVKGAPQRIAYFGADSVLKDTVNFTMSGNTLTIPQGFTFNNLGSGDYSILSSGKLRLANGEVQFNNNTLHGVKFGTLHLGTSSPHASAKVHITSTTQGVIICQMTTAQRLAISNPANGLMVFDTDMQTFCIKIDGTAGDGSTPSQGWAKIETTAAE